MESLLTPSESHAFQSFLTSLDVNAPEWALYTSGNPQDIVDLPVPHAQGREALAKATKELISLDADRWNPNAADPNSPCRPQLHCSYDHPHQPRQIGAQQQHAQRQTSLSHDTFPFLNAQKQQQHPSYQRPQQQQQPLLDPAYSDSQHLRPLFVPSSSIRQSGRGMQSSGPSTSATTSSSTTPNASTPALVHPFTPNGNGPSAAAQTRSRQQPSSPRSRKQHVAPIPSSGSSQKSNLLSLSQKKANHIQSEQKRRANIRRGYDALCDTVPALREAIREEEDREAEARTNGRNGTPKRGAGKRRDMDGSDRMDGRAGPRSENVVLSKSIEYINDLLSERQALLNRLQRARGALPPGHPALIPPAEQPLWEREWKGGEGKYDSKMEEGGLGGICEGEEEEEDEESS